MNGSNHLEESESRPFALCPVDLRKLCATIDASRVHPAPVDLVARERSLAEWFDLHELPEDARFTRQLIGSMTGQPEPQPATHSGPAELADAEAAQEHGPHGDDGDGEDRVIAGVTSLALAGVDA